MLGFETGVLLLDDDPDLDGGLASLFREDPPFSRGEVTSPFCGEIGS